MTERNDSYGEQRNYKCAGKCFFQFNFTSGHVIIYFVYVIPVFFGYNNIIVILFHFLAAVNTSFCFAAFRFEPAAFIAMSRISIAANSIVGQPHIYRA